MNPLMLIFCVVLLSCQEQSVQVEINKPQVVSEVTTMFNNYHEAIKQKGLTGEFPYLDNSSDFYWVPPEFSSALNYDQVCAILTQNAPAMKSVSFHWNSLTIHPLTNEIASFTGVVSGVTVDTSGNEQSMSLIESGTVIKRKDGWKLLCGQTSLLPAPKNQ